MRVSVAQRKVRRASHDADEVIQIVNYQIAKSSRRSLLILFVFTNGFRAFFGSQQSLCTLSRIFWEFLSESSQLIDVAALKSH